MKIGGKMSPHREINYITKDPAEVGIAMLH